MSETSPEFAGPPVVQPWRASDGFVLAALLLAALAIRVTHVDAYPSFDELWHIGTTKAIGNSLAVYQHNILYPHATSLTSLDNAGPFWAVWTRSMDGVLHPPLFVTLLRLWRDVFGESDRAAHAFSIAWSMVAIVFGYLTARLAFPRSLATLVTLGFVCSQTQVYFAQEVRAYQMMIAIGAIALWLMTRIEVQGVTRGRLIALGLLTLPLQLTHYFAFGGALAIGVFGLLRGGGERRWFVGAVATSAAIFLATWLYFALRQINDIGTGDAFLRVKERDLGHELLLAAGTPFRLIAERDYTMELTPVLSGVLFMLPWVLLRRFRPLFPWMLWLTLSIAPIVILDVTRQTVHVAYVRYLAIATPAVPLLFAGIVWPVRRWLAYLVAAVIVGTGLIYLISKNTIVLDAEVFEPVIQELGPRIESGDVIVTYAGAAPLYYTDVLMLAMSHSPRLFPRAIVLIDRPMTSELVAALPSRTLWLVGGGLDRPISELIPGGRITLERAALPNVSVRRIEIGEALPATTRPADDSGVLP